MSFNRDNNLAGKYFLLSNLAQHNLVVVSFQIKNKFHSTTFISFSNKKQVQTNLKVGLPRPSSKEFTLGAPKVSVPG